MDKNFSHSFVGIGRDKSGFHGTTIQTVVPCPTSNPEVSSLVTDSVPKKTILSRDRTVSYDIIESIVKPQNFIGEPSTNRLNSFSNLSLSDFQPAAAEIYAWNEFYNSSNRYTFTKCLFQQLNMVLPGIKVFFSLPTKSTTISEISPVAILDETADKKETVLKVFNKLYDKFQVGVKSDYVVIVGDGKSYDHMIKLKAEYGESLQWVLPYPGDWHLMKNLLLVFIKIYFDAGLKQLATICHHGSTLRTLSEVTNWSVTHRFMVHAWEALMRHQINSFFLSLSDEKVHEVSSDFSDVVVNILSSLDLNHDQDANFCSPKFTDEVCKKKEEIFEVFSDSLLREFADWRQTEREKSDTFAFWDQFLHVDFMSYLAFYFAVRSRNWYLRNAALKKLSCLFHAFDRHNYLRMIPHHLADLLQFPKEVLQYFEQGCFSVSFSGEEFYSVALDEAHEMGINLRAKNALNSFSQVSLATLTYYLPYRAEALHNFKKQIQVEREDKNHRETSVNYVITEETTISDYFTIL